MNHVYIISGPAGVGKSTTSKQLVQRFSNSAYISGDYISHMHVKGRQKPWESKEELALIWTNLLALTRNFLAQGIDVVIDYVTFPNEALWLKEQLRETFANVSYVVLWTDRETLLARDQSRIPEHRMGERCLILMNEFLESGVEKRHIVNNNSRSIEQVVEMIISGERYIM
ncbi:AAA family ATPase [Paenibacillus glycanilyticus]|uniref:AAA family ATPase n=1 Tax=Paenibacillus glycanilyticus TaxID=126569 RepID=UPI000FD784C1|nr:AAA family ATPase [Paenibacillus glycanilyticus]